MEADFCRQAEGMADHLRRPAKILLSLLSKRLCTLMNPKHSINELFKTHYFWDTDISLLDKEKNQRLIIERIISFGSLHEINLLFELYGKPAVVKTCRQIRYLDPKTINFLALLFNLSKKDFKCHTANRLKPGHWNS